MTINLSENPSYLESNFSFSLKYCGFQNFWGALQGCSRSTCGHRSSGWEPLVQGITSQVSIHWQQNHEIGMWAFVVKCFYKSFHIGNVTTQLVL